MFKYPLEVRLKAIELYHQKGSISIVARELNIPETTMSLWKGMYNKGYLMGRPHIAIKSDPEYLKLEHKFNLIRKELREAKLELHILRKGKEYISKTTIEIYEFILQNKSKYSVSLMCRAFKINPGNFHRWSLNPVSKRKEYKRVMMQEIKRVFYQHQGR